MIALFVGLLLLPVSALAQSLVPNNLAETMTNTRAANLPASSSEVMPLVQARVAKNVPPSSLPNYFDLSLTDTPISTSNLAGLYGYADMFGANRMSLTYLTPAGDSIPSFRDVEYVEGLFNDKTAYTNDHHSNYTLRAWAIAGWNGLTYDGTHTNNLGIYGLSAANTTRSTAGVSGGTFDAWQFGVGIADNEFAANNPSTASGQSVSMATVQAILNAGKGAADSKHHYWGVLITNNMLDGTAAIAANGPGKWGALLDGTNAAITSTGNGIIMPLGTPGSRVVYKPNYYTEFDASTNCYRWVANGVEMIKFCQSGGITTSLPIQSPVTTVGLLPNCNSGSKGYTYRVSDASAPMWNAPLAGGGSVEVLALCNGANWTAH
jgi:hypothetical protein